MSFPVPFMRRARTTRISAILQVSLHRNAIWTWRIRGGYGPKTNQLDTKTRQSLITARRIPVGRPHFHFWMISHAYPMRWAKIRGGCRPSRDSTTAASSRLFLAGYDSGSGQANGIGRSQRVFNGRTPADRGRTVRVKTSNTCVIIESCVQCTSSTVVRIGTILLIVEVVY
jgi:hypothetical protein